MLVTVAIRMARERGKAVIRQIVLLLLFLSGLAVAETNPHKNLSFKCTACHVVSSWQKIHFDHRRTGFELSGQHKKLGCRDCHSIKDFSNTPATCRGCHTDFHQGRLYQDCSLCHTTANWTVLDAYKAHANTSFQLLGKHQQLDCENCHRGEIEGRWTRLRSNCVDCHRADYESTRNPDHKVLAFGLVCENCHSPLGWRPASFKKHDQEFFPIYSGTHAGVWDNCTTCHTAGNDYSQFSCFAGCHEHNRASTDGKHREVANYRYESSACYSCHAQGKGGD